MSPTYRLSSMAPGTARRIVAAAAALLSLGSFWVYYGMGLTVAYGDAKSHLNVARRVIDNISPGIAQLGDIWLPLPHILMLPFVWNDTLWLTGIAGSIVSMASYVAASLFVFDAIDDITRDAVAGLIGASALMLSPSMLYMQTTPMTESLMIATGVGALCYLVRWGATLKNKYLYLSTLFTFLATLTRYDGWFYVPAIALCILVVGTKQRSWTVGRASSLAFMSWGVYGALLWMAYSWMIFGSPLNFAFGEGSGSWYANQQAAGTGMVLKGNLQRSTMMYGWAMVDVVGWLSMGLLWSGLLWYFVKHRLSSAQLAGYAFLSPILFNVISLFVGQSTMGSPHLTPSGWYNVRYGLMALPSVAFFSGQLAAGHWSRKLVVMVLILVQTVWMSPIETMPIIAEGSSSIGIDSPAQKLATDFRSRYDGQKILVSVLQNDRLLQVVGVPFKSIIHEGNHPYWEDSLKQPSRFAKWIIVMTNADFDAVLTAIEANPALIEDFDLVYDNKTYRVYRNRGDVQPIP